MNIHIIGIAGAMTASLAKELKRLGHQVTGSDQEKIYPPVSDILKNADIKINRNPISKNIDLVIVGSSFNSFENTRQEFETVKRLDLPYISATEYIAKYLGKNNSILVAGAYGKTTITSLLSWILINADFDPSYMIGGDLVNNTDSTRISNSNWSVIEADESIHGLDQKAKFLYYPVKYLLLTSADWEHKDSYKSEVENLLAFQNLIENIPEDGVLVINSRGYSCNNLSKFTKAKVITYNNQDSDYYISNVSIEQNQTLITINTPTSPISVNTELLGQFNFENILAAVAMADYLGIDRQIIQDSISKFKGVKRRIQLIEKVEDIIFFDDFAQSAPRIKSTLDAIKLHYPNNNIKVFFQPHASFLQHKQGLNNLNDAFANATEVVLGKISFSQKIDKNNRVTASDFCSEVGQKLIYLPINEDIVNHYNQTLKPKDILIYMSSGGIEGSEIINSIINNLKTNV